MTAVVDAVAATAREALSAARALEQPAFISLVASPGNGVPFAVKDNIDVAGLPTTVGCPTLTSPAASPAAVVERLVEAGMTPIGKTNLDQFATGLVGTRSPYGACHSVFSAAHVSGGSSSGSAVAVASGVVPLALGTDTAGSGRVPAAFNGLVGMKPSRGLVSAGGVVPACRSLDCVTTLTRTVAGARAAFGIVAVFDPADAWARPMPRVLPGGVAATMQTVAVPAGPIDLDPVAAVAWASALASARALGLHLVPVDVEPFLAVARLLYGGPWPAERYAAVGHLLEPDGPHLDPTVRQIVAAGADRSAVDAFRAFDELAALRRRTEPVWARSDALLLPVTPTHPTLAAVAADPVGANARLGTFTNFVNLLDLCAVAVPAGMRSDGLPFGVQLIAPAFADLPLLDLAARWCGEPVDVLTTPTDEVELVAVGAHLSGLPLNHLLTSRGGRLARRTRTAGGYRLVRVPGPGVARPALLAGDGPDRGFAVEVWTLPAAGLGQLAAELMPPLRFGGVRLADGTTVTGFVGDPDALATATDLSGHDGWREYVEHVPASSG